MGCCGCSLAASTVTAVVLGLVESIFGLTWNILVVVLMSQATPNSTTTSTFEATTVPESAFYVDDVTTPTSESLVDYDAREQNLTELWSHLVSNLASDEAFRKHLFEIVIAALVLNSFWLITTLALAVGNAEKCRDMLKPWIGTTIIITITDIAATIYFIFEVVRSNDWEKENFELRIEFFTNIFVFYAILFSRGGLIIWIINIALCVFVAQRVQQIATSKEKRIPYSGNYDMMPYSLNTPYDSFGTDRSTKPFRPHTPPPDYEGPNGRKGVRRASLSSSGEPSTLPLSASSRRPLSAHSYVHDERVELQHRASCAAETRLHGYENRGLVMEADAAWMGIPRPTLKSQHH